MKKVSSWSTWNRGYRSLRYFRGVPRSHYRYLRESQSLRDIRSRSKTVRVRSVIQWEGYNLSSPHDRWPTRSQCSLSCETRRGSQTVAMATTQVFQDWDSPHDTISSMTRSSTRKTTTTTTSRREVRLFWVKIVMTKRIVIRIIARDKDCTIKLCVNSIFHWCTVRIR